MRDGARRDGALVALAALLLLGGCGSGGHVSSAGPDRGRTASTATSQGSTSTTTTQLPPLGRVPEPAAPRRIPLLGFNDNSVAQGLVSAARDAQLLAQLGANSVRVTLDWAAVETTPGHFDFTWADGVYKAMSARGISVLWIPMFAPSWAAAPGCTPANCHAPPTPGHDHDWSDFIARVVTRYPRSAGIEVWNEPNYQFFWMPSPDPVRYTQLLQEAYHAVKRVNRSMPVISGGFGNKPVTSGPDMSLDAFTRAVFAHGGGAYMDAIGIHPYPLAADESPFLNAIADVRAIRKAYGFPDKPLWLTETGWTSIGQNSISQSDQALELTDLVRRAESMKDVHALYLHTLLDTPGSQDFEAGFGVLNPNGTPKPAGLALAKEFALQRRLGP